MGKQPGGTLPIYRDFQIVEPEELESRRTFLGDTAYRKWLNKVISHPAEWCADRRIVRVKESKAPLLTDEWIRESAVTGWVNPLEKTPNLWREFESIDTSNEEAILDFYQKYGWLGYNEDARDGLGGEPLYWFKWEQRRFKCLTTLWRGLTARSSRAAYKKWRLQKPPSLKKVLSELQERARKHDDLVEELLSHRSEESKNDKDAATDIICAEVNDHLSAVSIPPLQAHKGSFGFGFVFDTLLQAIYLQFRQIITSKLEMRPCPSCGMFFTPEHGNQKVCKERECQQWRKRMNKSNSRQGRVKERRSK